MPLPDPKLDDRSFQELVNEAKALIPHYAPEWTDHNLSDPGVTLIELFAWMTELMLFRLNRVPDKNYLRFMDLLGIRLAEAVPARTRLTMRLSAPQPGPITIPRGTEVATVRTAEEEAVSFTTDEPLVISPPSLDHFLFSPDDVNYSDYLERLQLPDEYFDAFQEPPLPGDALYLGFPQDISAHTLEIALQCLVEGIGVDPENPPLSWEAWCGDVRGWVPAHVERDETGGLNESGVVELDLPDGMQRRTLLRKAGYWLRIRVVQPGPRQPMYSQSPRINNIEVTAIGGSVMATHSTLVQYELLGRVTAAPGERFALSHTPVLPRAEDEYLEIELEDGTWTRWEEVETFAHSHANSMHYQIDGVTGEISFGPIIRDASGTERAYGAQPPRGASLRMRRYRQGGGLDGNVGANTLTVLRSSIPFVASVRNRLPATGGLDAESLEAAKLRVPEALASQDRAVTTRDYEFLARQASRRVARAKCIAVRSADISTVPPGTVELLIVPVLSDDTPRTIDFLQPPPDLLEDVRTYLDERRLLGTQLAVDGPAYVGVSVEVNVVARPGTNREALRDAVERRITRYLDPLLGGSEGTGWPFGRDLYLSEMQSVIQSVPGVEFAQDVTLYQVDLQTNQSRAAGQRITLAEDVLLLSIEHRVSVAASNR